MLVDQQDGNVLSLGGELLKRAFNCRDFGLVVHD